MRRDPRVAWLGMWLAVILLAGWGIWRVWSGSEVVAGSQSALPLPPPPVPVPSVAPSTRPSPVPPSPRGPLLSRSAPTQLVIKSIRLRTALDQVGLASDGTVETPSYARANRAAWYRLGPAPGELGASVILGHVDSKKDVAVFFYLNKLKPGDVVEVTRADKRTAVFTIRSVERFPKAGFPTDRVYADTPSPTLRLITCGGRYDKKRKTYLDNLIVFAELTSVRA